MKSRLRNSGSDSPKAASPPYASPSVQAFPGQPSSVKPAPAASPTLPSRAPQAGPPLPHRSKGRAAFGLILLSLVVVVGYLVWDAFFRYTAHGVVTGQVVEVSAPWSGTVDAVHVREGSEVDEGDALATITNPEINANLRRLHDDVRVTSAELHAQAANHALLAHQRQDAAHEKMANYYRLLGDYMAAKSDLQDVENQLQRYTSISVAKVVSEQDIASLQFKRDGLQGRIEHIKRAIQAHGKRIAAARNVSHGDGQLEPLVAKIKRLQNEMALLREKESAGTVRAPASGRILKTHLLAGELVEPDEPMLELVKEDSTELVIYVRQADSDDFTVGKEVEVYVEPNDTLLRCRVTRVGQRYEQPPEHLELRYRANELTLPVYLAPPNELPPGVALLIGAEVRVPVRWHAAFFSDLLGTR